MPAAPKICPALKPRKESAGPVQKQHTVNLGLRELGRDEGFVIACIETQDAPIS